MAGTLTEAEATAQVAAAHEKYMEGATGMPVQDDLDDRVADANATHTEVENDELATLLNTTTNPDDPNLETYAGGNVVVVAANRAGVDMFPEDAQEVEDLEHEVLVKDALDNDALFSRGGPIGDYTGPASVSPYVDGTWLAEASKMTGEKFF